jgi:hypothetical protein
VDECRREGVVKKLNVAGEIRRTLMWNDGKSPCPDDNVP